MQFTNTKSDTEFFKKIFHKTLLNDEYRKVEKL